MFSEQDLKVLEWDKIVEILSDCATTSIGKKACQNISIVDRHSAEIRLKQISEVKRLISERSGIDFFGIFDVKEYAVRASKNSVLSLEEIYRVRQTVMSFDRIKRFVKANSDLLPIVSIEAENLVQQKELLEELKTSITDSAELNSAKYPQIERYYKSIADLKNKITSILNRILSSADLSDAFQEKIITTRNERYVILLKSNMKSRLRGTIIDASSSGSTYYFEPESVAELNNSLMEKFFELQEEIYRIMSELSFLIGNESQTIVDNLKVIEKLDFISAGARFSEKTSSNEPVLAKVPGFKLISAYHPLLYLMIGNKTIKNDIHLDGDISIMIISGANTGGKTVLLKTIGICALLAVHGLHVPASPDSEIGLFTNIIADIGDDQNLSESLSTFSGEIVKINRILNESGPGTLVLLDEIISGTNPRFGAALARSVLLSMADMKILTVVTTHYPELSNLPAEDPRFMNGSVSFDLDTLKPTFRFRSGIQGSSYTFEIARSYGIKKEIINQAEKFVNSDIFSTEALLDKIQRYEKDTIAEKERITELQKKLNNAIAQQSVLNEKLRAEIEKAKERTGIEFIDEIKSYRKEISEILKGIRNSNEKEVRDFQTRLNSIEKVAQEALTTIKDDKYSAIYDEFAVERAQIGGRAFVKSMEKTCTIEDINSENKTVLVSMGPSVKARYKFNELLLLRNSAPSSIENTNSKFHQKAKKNRPEQNKSEIPFTMQTSYNTLDLRGLRAEEALNMVEEFFDALVMKGIKYGVIIHGHGTGTLKSLVRKNLKLSYYAKNFRPGEKMEGGDGVTVVEV